MPASKDLLNQLHEVVGRKLLERIESGEATASDFAQAIKFLKDNGIEAIPEYNNTIERLGDSLKSRLPFTNPSDPIIQ